MSFLYTVCLIGLFCATVMIWKARYNITTTYATAYAVFTDAATCITDTAWSAVLTQWIAHTSFGNFAN